MKTAPGRAITVALTLFALLFLLGQRGLNEPDEGRYAEVGREMLASGDWLVPRLNGNQHLSKPPLTYWLIATSLHVFGVNEFAARLPAALAAAGALCALFLMMRSAWDETTGLWAALIALTSVEFFIVARLITTDMLLACWTAWSVWAVWNWYISPDRSWRKIVWFYVFLGLGMLTKGPVALVLPAFAVIGLRWGNPNLPLRQMRWGWGLLIFGVIAIPWFVILALRQPELWHYFIGREVMDRVVSTSHGRNKPFWYFFPILLVGLLPWTFLLPAIRKLRATTGRQRDFARLCLAWAGLGLGLFTLSQSKLPTYLTPLYVPLAGLLAPVVGRWRWVAVPALVVCLAGVVFFTHIEKRLTHQTSARPFADRIHQERPPVSVVTYQTFLCGLPFYLERPVTWFRSEGTAPESVFEFSRKGGTNMVYDPAVLTEMLGGTQRVFVSRKHGG